MLPDFSWALIDLRKCVDVVKEVACDLEKLLLGSIDELLELVSRLKLLDLLLLVYRIDRLVVVLLSFHEEVGLGLL